MRYLMNTYDKIISGTFQLFLKKGFENVSTAEISKHLQISEGTLYYYFKSKDELILTVLQVNVLETYKDLLQKAKKYNKNTISRLKGLYTEMFGLNNENIDNLNEFKQILLLSFEAIQNYPQVKKDYMNFNRNYTNYLKDIIRMGKDSHELKADINVDEVATFIKSNLNGIFFLWIVQEDFDTEKAISINLKQTWEFIRNTE